MTVLTLEGCKLCGNLLELLSTTTIKFKQLDANSHDSLCDMLEVLLNNTTYPIVTFETSTLAHFLYIASDSSKLGERPLDDTSVAIGVKDVNELFEVICKLQNKI